MSFVKSTIKSNLSFASLPSPSLDRRLSSQPHQVFPSADLFYPFADDDASARAVVAGPMLGQFLSSLLNPLMSRNLTTRAFVAENQMK
jgi:hypothetical protein